MVADNDELLEDEKRMIHEIIDMGDTSVHEVMQPRVDMILVEDVETVRTAIERMHGTGYSRLPVYHEDMRPHRGHRPLQGPHRAAHGRPRENEPVGKYAYEAHVRARDEGHLPPACPKCKRIVNRWPSWWTSTGAPMV